ncbi:MAG: alpha/beta hydrolase family protein [Acidimicrobiales bacterium]
MTPRDHGSSRRAPAPPRTHAGHLARRGATDSRARLYRRRRFTAAVLAVLVAGVVVAACSIASGSGKPGGGSSAATSPKVTTTTIPSSFEVGIHTFDWTETGPAIFHVGPTGEAIPGRVLTTEVRYPTLAGSPGSETTDAVASHDGGPYPVIVFAHGFEADPDVYSSLLDAWVSAGFVVVSPVFPDESLQAVTAAGGNTDPTIADTLETDEFNEPGDMVYVMKQLQNLDNLAWGGHLKGVLDLSDVALAGQSDGADVVAALTFASSLRTTYDELPVAPKAVAVLSGSAWGALGSKPIGTYSPAPGSPALLQVQSDADGCALPGPAIDLFSNLQSGSEPKWFVTLLGADHLGPYEGASPWASAVQDVTTDFFELELGWRAGSLSAASVQSAGDVSTVAQTTTSVNENTMPKVPANGGCGIPS